MSGSSSGKDKDLKDNWRYSGPNALGLVAPARSGSRILALHIEFVAKPSEAHRVHAALPTALHSAMEGVAGFAGSLVMVSNYEARLVTVVTLWAGEDRARRCEENIRWVRALVAPYQDRCLRVQTLATYLPPAAAQTQEFLCSPVLQETEIDEEQEVPAFVA